MKKFIFITTICLMAFVNLPTMAESPSRPGQPNVASQSIDSDLVDNTKLNYSFITDREEWFRGRYGEDFSQAFAARFGYGVGTLTNESGQHQTFSWFAWCNTDAYLQFYIDCPISPNQRQIIHKVLDGLGRTWDSINFDDDTAWIGTSNCWMLNNTNKANDLDRDYMRVNLGLTIAKMVEDANFDAMTVIGYYQ